MLEFNIPQIDLKSFSYELPPERIADRPAVNRDDSKLLSADSRTGEILHKLFKDVCEFIPENAVLVMNSSKVIPARILVNKPTGGAVEILCVEPVRPSRDPQEVYKTKGSTVWKAIIGGKRVREGAVFESELTIRSVKFSLIARVIEKEGNIALVEFTPSNDDIDFGAALEAAGKTPLPPYIKREADNIDKERYQTVYARENGSIAAPTAGLHFTDEILETLTRKNIEFVHPVLHVGPGTFKPIDVDNISDFQMHGERFFVSIEFLDKMINALSGSRASRVCAVGTTSVRTVESLYWLGARVLENAVETSGGALRLKSFEPYRKRDSFPSPVESYRALKDYAQSNSQKGVEGVTELLIMPGYDFKIVKCLITNFHIPESTLILLVAAFAGADFQKRIYHSALENEYRFLSYGDSSIIYGKEFL